MENTELIPFEHVHWLGFSLGNILFSRTPQRGLGRVGSSSDNGCTKIPRHSLAGGS
jgi:hypothetical protein